MVKCMYNGKVWNTTKVEDPKFGSRIDEYFFPFKNTSACLFRFEVIDACFDRYMISESEFYHIDEDEDKTTRRLRKLEVLAHLLKMVEDEFDENGRPRLKIVYIDPEDWSDRVLMAFGYHIQFIQPKERNIVDRLNERAKPGQVFKLLIVVFWLQDRDYWPGTGSDPKAMQLQVVKNEALKKAELKPYGARHDFMEIRILSFDYDEFSVDLVGVSQRRYDRFFNPNQFASKFVLSYLHKIAIRKDSWEEYLKSDEAFPAT